MIFSITKKEYAQIKRLQENGFHQCLLFKLSDGSTFKCDTMAAAGLKEIQRFRLAKKKIEDDRQLLQDAQGVLL